MRTANASSPLALPAPSLWCRWPLPALATWGLAWALFVLVKPIAGAPWAAAVATLAGTLAAFGARTAWRRAIVAAGFPLAAAASGLAAAWPAWVWLLPLALLALIYPLRAWRDAPWFPTPAGALDGLVAPLQLGAGARLLDAGSGVGDGLRALRRAWPQAAVEGVEFSAALAWVSRLRCRWARVRRGDLWAQSWAGFDLVYLFQRPESMARAWAKAQAELAPGAWLVSLDFDVPGQAPDVALCLGGGRWLRAWRMPAPPHSQPGALRADIAQ